MWTSKGFQDWLMGLPRGPHWCIVPAHGLPMGLPLVGSVTMSLPCVCLGSPMHLPWVSLLSPLGLPWESHGAAMGISCWDSRGLIVLARKIPMGLPWNFHGPSIGLSWSHGTPMGLLRRLHSGGPGLSRDSHGTPMTLLCSHGSTVGLP